MLIGVFYYIFVKLTINVAWSTSASIKKLKSIYAQLDQPTPLFFQSSSQSPWFDQSYQKVHIFLL